MPKDPKIFLQHILESIAAIEDYTKDLMLEDFLKAAEKQDAVLRRIEVIGEAVKNMPSDFKKLHPQIPWQDISDMRNKLIHEYFGVDLELVWSVAEKDIPQLKGQVKELLREE